MNSITCKTRTTTTGRDLTQNFFRVFPKNRHPEKLPFTFFSTEVFTKLFLLKEAEPSHDRKMIT